MMLDYSAQALSKPSCDYRGPCLDYTGFVYILVLLCLVWMTGSANQGNGVFADDPSDITVFEGDGAVFACVTNDELIIWRVNGTDINDLSHEIQDKLVADSNTAATKLDFFTLTIPGSVEFNATRVQCVTTHGSIESMNATLYIQGSLSSVMDVKISSDGTSVTIAWTAPFSLDVTNVDPDIWYSVLIYNVTDEPTTIPCTDCTNITDTNYTFTPDFPSPCHKYVFTVIPVNGAGQGGSQNVTGYTINDLFPTIVVAIQAITSLGASQFQVTFRVTGDVESVCTVSLHGLYKSSQLLAKGENVSFTLPANIQYNTSFIITNAAIQSRIVSHIVFTTFDVQNVEAKATGSDIVITGIFAANSSALGYFLVLRDDIKVSDTFKAVLRYGREENVSSSVTVPASTYTVLVYDLEHDALPNKDVAYQVAEAVAIRNGTDYTSTSDFNFTVTANISLIESVVYVTCDIPEEYSDILSCVLVYREDGNKTLVVEEYSNNDEFPIHIPVNKSGGIYTFAVFGKNGSIIDEMPTTTVTCMVNAPMATLSPTTSMPHPTVAGPGEQDSSASVNVAAVIGGVLAVVLSITLVALVVILCIISLRVLKHDKQGNLVFPHSPRKMEVEASSASVVLHVASSHPVETSSDTTTREDQRKEQPTNVELPPPDAKEQTTVTAPWPPAGSASAVLIEPSANTDSEVHREQSADTDSEVHKELSADTDSEVHKELSADTDSEVHKELSADTDLGNEPRTDTDSKDQGHTRGVVYTQVVTLPAREQTIKPLFSLLTDTSFEYSVIKPHEAPIESSSATNEPVCEGSDHDCLPVSTHATGVGNTSVTEATVKENNEVEPVPVEQETNKERRETDQDSTSERKVHSGPGPVSEKSDTTFNKH